VRLVSGTDLDIANVGERSLLPVLKTQPPHCQPQAGGEVRSNVGAEGESPARSLSCCSVSFTTTNTRIQPPHNARWNKATSLFSKQRRDKERRCLDGW
jgi:hypothetical protein